jgi:arylsulfatase A-like enzyme
MSILLLLAGGLLSGSVHAAGPIARYTFDNADIIGTAAQADQVGNRDTGEPGPGVTPGVSGRFGEAYRFAGGADNLMTIAAGLVPDGSAERTLSIWFNQSADLAGSESKILGYGAPNAGQAFDLSLESGGIRVRHFGGNITYGSGHDFDGADAGWHHLAVRVNPGAATFADVEVFLDGNPLAVAASSRAGTGQTLNTADSTFGIGTSSVTVPQGFSGSLDEFRIYDRALIDSEIAFLAMVDTDPPILSGTDIVDNRSGGPVEVGTRVTYTLSFSEAIDADTVNMSDFDNAGTSTLHFGAITETAPGVFRVEVTPATTGTLRLRIPTTSTIEDLSGNLLVSDPAIQDDTTLDITPDTTPPTLAGSDIVDNLNGTTARVGRSVRYTLTFNEDLDADTVDPADFANAGTSSITIGSITETTPGVLTVDVIPGGTGTLKLQIAADASITDSTGLALITDPVIVDDSTLTVAQRLPNIVILLVDDMGPQDTSVPFLLDGSGQPIRYKFNDFYQTPNMDTLASLGMRFTTAYAQSVCSPTRTGLLTGRTSARHGVTDWVGANDAGSPVNWRIDGITDSENTLPKLLRAAGYRTIHIGKAHFAKSPVEVEDLGFDVNIAGNEHGRPDAYTGDYGKGSARAVPDLEAYHNTGTFLTKALALEAKAAIGDAVNADRPFFLNMCFYAVHTPFTTNPDATGNYSDAVSGDHTKFATMIEGVDIAIGEIRQHLVDLGVAEDTIIFFLGDNGTDSPATSPNHLPSGSFSDWPMRGKKGSKWEGGTRVPLIATWALPDAGNALQQALPIPANSIETDIVTTWDLPATLLDLIDRPVPADFGEDSHSLLPYLSGAAGTHRPQEIAVHYPHAHRSNFFSWIRQGDLKLIYNYQSNSHELYDLATDPTESHNLAASRPEAVMALTRRLARKLDGEWGPAGVMLPTIGSLAPSGNVISIPYDPGIDLDRDGLDDLVEDPNLNGLIDAGETDPDNDNSDQDLTPDGVEVQLGTDPLDPGSFFSLRVELDAESSMVLTWPSRPGTSFEIRGSPDLSDWSTVIDSHVPAADPGSTTRYTVVPSALSGEFLRVILK